MMTRREARMIAEELYNLMRKEQEKVPTYITARKAAEMLGWTLSTLYHRINEIPHTGGGRGGTLRFTEEGIHQYIQMRR